HSSALTTIFPGYGVVTAGTTTTVMAGRSAALASTATSTEMRASSATVVLLRIVDIPVVRACPVETDRPSKLGLPMFSKFRAPVRGVALPWLFANLREAMTPGDGRRADDLRPSTAEPWAIAGHARLLQP